MSILGALAIMLEIAVVAMLLPTALLSFMWFISKMFPRFEGED